MYLIRMLGGGGGGGSSSSSMSFHSSEGHRALAEC
jgi:hypothetical protein